MSVFDFRAYDVQLKTLLDAVSDYDITTPLVTPDNTAPELW